MSPDPRRPSTERTRRQFLRRSGVALAGSCSTLTAGCLSSLPPLGEDQRYGRLDVPPADEPAYRRWLPAPSSLDEPVDQYHFVTLDSTTRRPGAPEKFVAGRASVRASLDYFGIGFERYDQVVSSLLGTLVEASFDRASVVRTIEESGYERTGEYRGFGVFARRDVDRRVAVGDDVVVWTSAYRHESPDLEAIVDAGTGNRPRYHDENAGFERLTTAAGSTPYLGVNTDTRDPTDRRVMMADAFRFEDGAAYQVVQYYYHQPDRVPTSGTLESRLQAHDYRFTDDAEAFDVDVDGRLATVETRVPPDGTRDHTPEYDLPQVTWGVAFDEENDRVRFRHEAGESVPADRLFYDVDRQAAPGRIEKRALWAGADTVEEGATATVDLSDRPTATDVNLVYSTEALSFHVLFGVDLREDADG